MEPLLTPYPIISLLSTHITQDDLINLSLTSQSAHHNLFLASRAHWKNLYSKTAPPTSCTFTASKTGYHRFSVALKELQVGRCIRCFTAVCKGCVYDTSLHKRLSNWMRACTLRKRLRKVCNTCESRRPVRRVKVCGCEHAGGVWICGECSVGVELSDDLSRREQQQMIRPGLANDVEVEICWGTNHRYGSNGKEEGVGEVQRQQQQQRGEDMVVVCSWCEGLAGGEFPPS
ncbi:hypothetical protein B9Z19DRAFT_1092758 [Tuber borchii]|uniref:Uncharacterized protein n=1 Tax=Tuber borchii TaxID=42251 RepID=A0A2T6ZG71_TUBBO|nr:hypothetical protein B9Z19DRAFT_1092758 [Tuber borchii]